MSAPAPIVWVDGPQAQDTRGPAVDLLRELDRPATLVDSEPIETSISLARAGVISLFLGEPSTEEKRALERAGIPRAHVTVERSGAKSPARQVLAVVDHPLEVATRPIFIVGQARSGTTWMLDLLGNHPQVRPLFETEIMMSDRVSFLTDPGEFDTERSIPVLGTRKGPGQLVDQRTAILDLRAVYARWLARAVEPEHEWLVEKTPAHIHSADAIAALFPEARFVWVVRDLRDLLVSAAEAHRSWMNGPYGASTAELARCWRECWQSIDRLQAIAQVHVTRYEELHAAPVRELMTAFAFCGIPCSEQMASDIVAANRFDVLTDTGPTRFRRSGRVGDWRAELGLFDRGIASAYAGHSMLEHRYISAATTTMRLADAYRFARRTSKRLISK